MTFIAIYLLELFNLFCLSCVHYLTSITNLSFTTFGINTIYPVCFMVLYYSFVNLCVHFSTVKTSLAALLSAHHLNNWDRSAHLSKLVNTWDTV